MLEWLEDGFDWIVDTINEIDIDGKAFALAALFTVAAWAMMLKSPMWTASLYFKGWRLYLMLGLTPFVAYGVIKATTK